jgi:D-alanyl-D-alanine carboxypeptidase
MRAPERLTAGWERVTRSFSAGWHALGDRWAVSAVAEVSNFNGLNELDEAYLPPGDNIFLLYHYYIEDNLPYYLSYREAHPLLSAAEVTWKVNAGLHRVPFEDAAVINYPNPLLVNPFHRLPENFIPPDLAEIDEHGRLATPQTIDAFRRMREGAQRAGFDIAVQSAYRTIARQRELYEQAVEANSVARPMFSEHHTGRALDLWGPDGLMDLNGPTDVGRWVKENAHEYGFIIRYTYENQHITGYIYEPWHITFVGETIARAMHENNYGSLEEYVAKHPGARLPDYP